MNSFHDPELEDVLQDAELRRVASLLHAAKAPEPPLDDAFRTGLRRQLMQEAWSRSEGRIERLLDGIVVLAHRSHLSFLPSPQQEEDKSSEY